MSKFIQNKTQV